MILSRGQVDAVELGAEDDVPKLLLELFEGTVLPSAVKLLEDLPKINEKPGRYFTILVLSHNESRGVGPYNPCEGCERTPTLLCMNCRFYRCTDCHAKHGHPHKPRYVIEAAPFIGDSHA